MSEERIEFKVKTKMSKSSLFEIEDLISYARGLGQEAIAITDYNSVDNFIKIYDYLKKNDIKDFKVIYGAVISVLENEEIIPVTVIVRNKVGLKNLYKIISKIKTSNLEKFNKCFITKKELVDLEEGLFFGLDTSFMYDIYDDLTDEQIMDDMMWYDFIEVTPKTCIHQENYNYYLRRIIRLGVKSRKLVIATGDVHYLEEKEKKDYEILFPNKDSNVDRHLKSTEEMKDDFSFLQDDYLVNKIVIDNPQKLAILVENVELHDDEFYIPKIDNSRDKILEMIYDKAYSLYGNPLPEIIKKRIEDELEYILEGNHEVLYLIAKELVDYSKSLGYYVGSRGGVGSSFVAYLLGITNINSLQPHYYCPNCKSLFFENKNGKDLSEIYNCCVDMPNRKCPVCHDFLLKDGFNIPYETFLGCDKGKIPDIDFNFSSKIQYDVQNHLKKLFGDNHVIRAGTKGTISSSAYTIIQNYFQNNDLEVDDSEVERLAKKLMGNKRVNGQHPGGVFIIPSDKEVYDFTPVWYPGDDVDSKFLISQIDYHDFDSNLCKFDILAHTEMDMIKELEDLTGIKVHEIPLGEKDTMNLIINNDTKGIREFDDDFFKEIAEVIKPKTFDELISVSALSHGTFIWENNIELLIKDKVIKNKDIISTRDDIMVYLMKHGVERDIAYNIMEFVRKGRSVRPKYKEEWENYINILKEKNIPNWFIDVCSKTSYLFPKSHVVVYIIQAYYLAYFKTHYPKYFDEVVEHNL